jgi:hypothetical protein
MLEISYDRRARQWETAWIEIDDERVFASETTVRDDREYTAKKAAAEKERARQQRKKETASSALRSPAPSTTTAAQELSHPDPDQEARRESGRWREIASFEGVGRYDSPPFRAPAGGWRYRWSCDGDATIRLYDAAGRLVGEEIEVYSGDRGTQFVRKGPGDFSLKITTDERWMLVVEE